MLSQSVAFQTTAWRLSGGVGYYHTDSYDSRVYLYEAGPLYTFGVSQFSGQGLRYWLMARWQVSPRLLLTAKAGTTDYFDRSTTGSGLQQVDASAMTDVDLQVKWQF